MPSAREMLDEALGLLGEGKQEAGIERLQAVVEADPDFAEAWGHLSWQLALADRHEEALDCLNRVVRLEPDNLEARWRRADRLARLGRLDEAERQYREMLEGDPSCLDAQAGLACVEWLRKQGQKEVSGFRVQGSGMPGEKVSGLSVQSSGKQEEADSRRQTGEHETRQSKSERTKPDADGDNGSKPPTPHFRLPTSENERRARFHLERGDRRLRSLPFHLHVETSTRCNCACITCAKGHGAYFAEDMQLEVFERIERELLPTAVRVNLTGSGEPLLGRGISHFYDEAARCWARVYLVTNATLLTMRRIEKFARRPTDLIASIDGATRETFEDIRRPSKYDRVIEALRLYKKMREIFPEVGSTLGINFVALRRNIEELPALVDLAAELGAQFISVLDFATGDVPPEIAREHLAHSPELANRCFDEAAERAKRRGVVLHLPPKFGPPAAPPDAGWLERLRRAGRLFPERNRFPQRCPDPWTTVLISTSGLVHPCCASRRVMGDLKTQPFGEIWNGRRYRQFRRWIRTALPPPECRQCNQLWGVNAGNPSAIRAKEGLLVKMLYRLEGRWDRFVTAIRNRISPPPPPPKPNYAAGRPLRGAPMQNEKCCPKHPPRG